MGMSAGVAFDGYRYGSVWFDVPHGVDQIARLLRRGFSPI
jgi:hypothetical protein